MAVSQDKDRTLYRGHLGLDLTSQCPNVTEAGIPLWASVSLPVNGDSLLHPFLDFLLWKISATTEDRKSEADQGRTRQGQVACG